MIENVSYIQKSTHSPVSLLSGAELCGWKIQVSFSALSLTHCRNLGKARALLNKMGIIIVLSKQMCRKTLLINVC